MPERRSVLLLTYRWMGGFPDHVLRALRAEGHEVHSFVAADYTAFDPVRAAHTRLLRAKKLIGRSPAAALAASFQAARDAAVLSLAKEKKPDIVLSLVEDGLLAGTVRALRKIAPVAVWCTDDPFRFLHLPAALHEYSQVFSFDPHYLRALERLAPGRTSLLLLAGDPEVYRPVSLGEEERRRFGTDVAFVGSRYPDRVALLASLAALEGLDLGIWGFPDTRGLPPPVARSVRGGIVSGEDANRVYNASRIVLIVHHRQVVDGVTRVFEAPLAGAFQIVDEKPLLPSILTPGREVVTWRSAEDLTRTIRHYLDRPEERDRIARSARARILAEHTYAHRVRTLVSVTLGEPRPA